MEDETSQEQVYYKDTRLTHAALWNLDRLFDSAPPRELREHILEIYHIYVFHTHEALPLNFDRIAINLYHLLHCLGTLAEAQQKESGPDGTGVSQA